MKKSLWSFFTGVCLAGLVLSGAPGFAQDEGDTFMLEEITVTAEKRDTNLQKTAISIQTVDGKVLTSEAKTRIDEIMQGVVGVQTQAGQVGTDFFMRGLGKAEGNNPVSGLSQAAVAVVIDGVYQNRGEVVRGGTVDMAQAEVMRGTQSTTLGGSSLAGAVSMVSNNPVFKYEGSGSLGVGDYNLLTTQAVLNVPFSDNQAARIAFSSERRDGYLSNNAGNSDQTNGRIKYRWQPSDDLNVVATVSKQMIGGNGVDTNSLTYYGYWEGYNEDKDPNYGCTGDGCYDRTIGYPIIYGHVNNGVKYDDRDNPWDDGMPSEAWPNQVFRNTKIEQYSVDLDWDLAIGTLSVVPSYQTAEFHSQESPRASSEGGESWNAELRDQETAQLDMQLASPEDAPFEWLAGLYYYDTEFSGYMYSANLNPSEAMTDPGAPQPPTNEDGSLKDFYDWEMTNPSIQKTYAAYGNVSYPILEVLRLNAGLRYTKDEKSETKTGWRLYGFDQPSDAEFFANGNVSTLEGDWDSFTYRVGGEYDLSDKTMLYALYATGYQPGQLTSNGQTDEQELDQYTLGVKSDLLGSRLRVNVEGFHSTYYNREFRGSLQVWGSGYTDTECRGTGGPGDPAVVINSSTSYCVDVSGGATVPELLSMGVDMEVNFLITENDRIDFNAEWLKSEQNAPDTNVSLAYFEGLADVDLIDGGAETLYNALNDAAAAYDGLTLQNSPEWSANFSYSHIFEMADGSTLTPKFNIEYKDTFWSAGGGPSAKTPDPPESYQDAYQLYNFYLNWTSSDDKFNVSGYVKNIGDKPILTNYGPEAMATVSLLAPRTMGLVFSVKL